QIASHAVDNQRREEEADTKLLELDRRGVVLLRDRERELAPGQELGFLAALRDQIRLRERSEEAALGQRLDEPGAIALAARQEEAASALGRREEEIGRRAANGAPARRPRP